MRKELIVLAAVLLLPLGGQGQEAAPPDFELARDAVAAGEILPLARVLARVQELHPGQTIEVELEDEDGVRVYEIEIVTPDGRLIEVDVNAATGEVLGAEEDVED